MDSLSRTPPSGSLADTLGVRLQPFEQILFALLFGSRATERARPDSDIDLAIYVSPSLTARARFDIRAQLTADLSDLGDLDVVVLNDVSALLGHRALQGTLVLSRDRRACVRYFVATLAEAGDERYFGQMHRRARERRLAEGRDGGPGQL